MELIGLVVNEDYFVGLKWILGHLFPSISLVWCCQDFVWGIYMPGVKFGICIMLDKNLIFGLGMDMEFDICMHQSGLGV